MKWCPCGKSCTSPARIGLTAPKAGLPKTTVCLWRTLKTGKKLCAPKPKPSMIWAARSGSTRSEGMNCSQSGSDCKNSTSSTTLKLKASLNCTPSGSGKANSRSTPSGTRTARSNLPARTRANWFVKPWAIP